MTNRPTSTPPAERRSEAGRSRTDGPAAVGRTLPPQLQRTNARGKDRQADQRYWPVRSAAPRCHVQAQSHAIALLQANSRHSAHRRGYCRCGWSMCTCDPTSGRNCRIHRISASGQTPLMPCGRFHLIARVKPISRASHRCLSIVTSPQRRPPRRCQRQASAFLSAKALAAGGWFMLAGDVHRTMAQRPTFPAGTGPGLHIFHPRCPPKDRPRDQDSTKNPRPRCPRHVQRFHVARPLVKTRHQRTAPALHRAATTYKARCNQHQGKRGRGFNHAITRHTQHQVTVDASANRKPADTRKLSIILLRIGINLATMTASTNRVHRKAAARSGARRGAHIAQFAAAHGSTAALRIAGYRQDGFCRSAGVYYRSRPSIQRSTNIACVTARIDRKGSRTSG